MPDAKPNWTFLTNHSHVFLLIAADPTMRGRDIAERVGITEGSVQAIISDLEAGGYITRRKVGRRNHYELHAEGYLRHPVEAGHKVEELLHLVEGSAEPAS